MPNKPDDLICQLKVTLEGSKPPIWRRLLVRKSITLYKLHQTIQVAMGWGDSHLHQFMVRETIYGMTDFDSMYPIFDERRFRLGQIAGSEKFTFRYEYDFGDSWLHRIQVEKILPAEPGAVYPRCIKGKGACPPEDVGGIWGYYAFLEVLGDPKHQDYDEMMEWWGGTFDPEKFDIDEVNRVLKQIR